MTRISKVPIDQWDPELRAMTQADAGTPLEQGAMRMFAHAPAVAKAIAGFGAAIVTSRTLSPRLTELVRLRIAFHNQCRSCMAIRYSSGVEDGVTEQLVCSLAKPYEAPDLSAAEKAALGYADRFAGDHLSIDDTTYDQLRTHFSEAELVELGVWVAFCVGFGRLAASWDMIEELPDNFRDKSRPIAPWNEESIVVRG